MTWKRKALTITALLGAALASGCPSEPDHGGDVSATDRVVLATRFSVPTKSSTIALTLDDRFALVANVDENSATLVEVRGANGRDADSVVDEVGVGEEPRFVAITPDGNKGYVSNGRGDVSVLDLSERERGFIRVSGTIEIPGELRGLALTPNGRQLWVANFSDGIVHRIDTDSDRVVAEIPVGVHPYALAITNDGDADDGDETVFVSEFFSEPIPGGPGEGFDTGRRGVIFSFPTTNTVVSKHTVSPLADCGFTADRTAFAGTAFAAPPGTPDITKTPQGCFPNQLHALLIRNNRLWSTSVAAAPEPPVIFNNNIQALVNVLDTSSKTEVVAETVNLNNLVKVETQPNPATNSLVRLFLGDLVDLVADESGNNFLAVSRSGNYVVRAGRDASGKLTFQSSAMQPAFRIKTGWLPTGAIFNRSGDRAYVYNEGGASITAINLQQGSVIELDIATTTIPEPGSFLHDVRWGKLAFFTSLGTPNDGLRGLEIRGFDPLSIRDAATGKGKASDNGWSSCGSCHPGGLTDGVTWLFGDGPRQTLPLDATYSKTTPHDRRVENWSAVRSSVTEFNNNSRGVQGGLGFADNFAAIFNHGFTEGQSEALDVMTLWVQTVRTPAAPRHASPVSNTAFVARCASCHGGSKWTKSTVFWNDNPTFPANPSVATVAPFDAGLKVALDSVVNQPRDSLESYTGDTNGNGVLDAGDLTLRILEPVGTFSAANPIEVRGQGQLGKIANGAVGFNVPSLLGVAHSAPYFHDGSARTLAQVFAKHALGMGTIASTLSAAELAQVEAFIRSIDGTTTPIVDSAADTFRDQLGP